jgi:hypothetical protein
MKNDLIHSFYYALPNNGSQEGINSTTSRMKEAKICAEIADEFAIDFAEWILKKCNYSGEDSNKGSKYHIKGLDGLALYYPATYTIEELLQIYKKEKQ